MPEKCAQRRVRRPKTLVTRHFGDDSNVGEKFNDTPMSQP